MPRSLPPTLHSSSALTRRLGLALALLAAACGKTPQTIPAATAPASAATPTAEEAELAARLERLRNRLEEARVQHDIPGMAVAVVKGDQVIFAEGFGFADLEAKRPVTPKTIFAVGSTTKAFASALVAMQIDAGKLAWDDPLSQHVPELVLRPREPAATAKTDTAAPAPTLRDALSHRTGFTRMSMLWASGELSDAEIFALASGAEPIEGFRDKFLYNNVVYAAAGEAAARAAGTPWPELLRTRLLEPLGMKSTTTSVTAVQADPELARGYRFREVTKVHEPVPMRALDSIAPAGAINSSVLDMAQWLRLQLGRGTYAGKRLVSADRLQDTWAPQIDVAGGIRYGLGWMIGDWQGHRVVEHGGNIDGFAAEVAMLPDDDLGFVLLTNTSSTPLQRASMGIVFDSLLGELPDEGKSGPALDLRPYPGRYVADFGPFDDVRFTVSDEGGKLYLDVPGQTKYELRPPNEQGRWAFALTDTIQVAFDLDEQGKAQVLHLHQGGLDFELPREGYSFPPDFTAADVEAELGRYRSEQPPLAATIRLEGGRLVADVEGQMAYVLHKPDDQGRFRFRAKDDIAVSFRKDKRGRVDALVLHQGGVDQVLPRVTTAETPLPTVAQLLSRNKAADFTKRLEALGTIEMVGKVRFPSSNVEGRFRIVFDAQRRHRVELDLGRHGRAIDTYDGTAAWSVSTMSPPTEAQGPYLEQAALSSNPVLAGDFTRGFDQAVVEGRVGKGKDERVVVVLRAKGLPPVKLLVDPRSGDVRRLEQVQLAEGVGGIPSQGELGDYRKALGLRLPFRISTFNEHSGATILEVDGVKRIEGDTTALFAGPAKL
jgi:CubicO group peptidase (beta-lactamase class C family)